MGYGNGAFMAYWWGIYSLNLSFSVGSNRYVSIHQLTHNLCFNIPFHLYIHDHDLEQAICTLTSGANVCILDMGK